MINNPDRLKQIIDFSDLEYGYFHPTDIDGCLEIRALNLVVLFEYKLEKAEMPAGQKITLTEMTRALRKSGKRAFALQCSHHVLIPELPIAAGAALVTAYYDGNNKEKWVELKEQHTVREFVNYFMGVTDGEEETN